MKVKIFISAVLLANSIALNPSSAIEKNSSLIANDISSLNQTPGKIVQAIPPKVIKLRLADSGVSVGSVITWGFGGLIQKRSTDWVRLEISDNQVRVIHTTRTTNWLTQFSKWWDHPVRKIAFKPDSCQIDNTQTQGSPNIENQLREIKRLYDSKLITEQQYQELQRKIINQISINPSPNATVNSECVVLGENGIVKLQDMNLVTKGEFKIEYLEGDEWKYAAFRVPAKNYE
ncbi:hypothetical protein NIES2100_41550 [Calothrix sp. NIES-2100]|uniref:SHOCT domain-containing protein n=1 Tax=Calothrix sp. NIES-2100 TaxID=1954172 RepID=UPI000B60EA88|nr:hypothetical protein NIES2100_41550 [Calothrix sp. NIES-2100]